MKYAKRKTIKKIRDLLVFFGGPRHTIISQIIRRNSRRGSTKKRNVNKETIFFRGLRRIFLFLRNFRLMQSCVLAKKRRALDIWSFQWSSKILRVVDGGREKSQSEENDLFVYGESQPRLLLIDNKSVSFLIKCPMPVIEPRRGETNDGKEKYIASRTPKKQNLYPGKSTHKTKDKRHNVFDILSVFTKSSRKNMLFPLSCLENHSESPIPYVDLLVLPARSTARRGGDALSGNRVARNKMFRKSINLLKDEMKCFPPPKMYY